MRSTAASAPHDDDQEMAPILSTGTGDGATLSVTHRFAEVDCCTGHGTSHRASGDASHMPSLSCGGVVAFDQHDSWTRFFLSWPGTYHEWLDMTWSKLLLGAFALFTAVVAAVGALHLAVCYHCGGRQCALITSFYYGIVSIVANGGYEGEEASFLTPGHQCFAFRTVLTWLAAFTGLFIASGVAAVLIGRASRHTTLGNRIHFSRHAIVRRLRPTAAPRRHASSTHTIPSDDSAAASGEHAASSSSRISNETSPLVLQLRVASAHHRPLLNVEISLFLVVVRSGHQSGTEGRLDHHAQPPVLSDADQADNRAVRVFIEPLPFVCPESTVPAKGVHARDHLQNIVCQPGEATQRLNLWYPVTVTHCIDHPNSPLRACLLEKVDHGGTNATPPVPTFPHGVQVVCQVTGIDSVNGANVVARHVYHAPSISSGFRFVEHGLVVMKPASGVKGSRASPSGNATSASRHLHVNIEQLSAMRPDV